MANVMSFFLDTDTCSDLFIAGTAIHYNFTVVTLR